MNVPKGTDVFYASLARFESGNPVRKRQVASRLGNLDLLEC
jgi:hypothetical protein